MDVNVSPVLRDAHVDKIIGAQFVSDAQGNEKLHYLVVVHGKGQAELCPMSQCECPDAVRDYEQRYSNAKWGLDALELSTSDASVELFGGAQSDSAVAADEQSSHGSASENDSHLDHIASDDSYWAMVDDEQGRPGTDPEARAAIRAAWAGDDETFTVAKSDAKDEESNTSGSDDSSEPAMHSKADASDDSLMAELGAVPYVSQAVQGRARRFEAVQGSKRRRRVAEYLADADDDSDTENQAPKKIKRKRQAARKLSFGEANRPGSATQSQASGGQIPSLPKYSTAVQRKIKTEIFSSDDDAVLERKKEDVIVLSSVLEQKKEDVIPQNISTPVPQGDRPPVPSAVRIQARPHEFGNVTLGSLASVLPPSRAERSGRNNAVSTSGAANFFDDAEPAPSRDYDYDVYHAEPLVVAWDPRSNRALHFAAVREGQSQGGFMDFIDGLGQGRGFRVDRGSRFACVIGRSRPVRGVPPEYYAVVTFPTHAQAQLCIDYITAQAMHFNMTPMGVQGTWRMLTAQWSNNPHYNGKADAEYEAALRRQYPR